MHVLRLWPCTIAVPFTVILQLDHSYKVALGVLLNPVNKEYQKELEPYMIQVFKPYCSTYDVHHVIFACMFRCLVRAWRDMRDWRAQCNWTKWYVSIRQLFIYICVCDNLTKPQSLVPFVCYMYVVGLERSTNVTFKTSFDSDTKALLLLVPAIIIKLNEW